MSQLSHFERWWISAWPHRLHIRHHVPRFLKACPEPFRGQVLEVGAGSGWTSRRILETFPQVELTATDVDASSAEMFERLRDRYGRRLVFKQADVMSLPFDRGSFDIVIAIHVLHHIDDIAGAVQQLLRSLRPGGLLGISDENPDYVVGPLRWLFPVSSRPTRPLLEDVLRREGCEVMHVHGDVHYNVWARKPYSDGEFNNTL